MANLYGDNYNNSQVVVPKVKVDAKDYGGRERVSFDEHTFVANVVAIGDVLNLGAIPKGARVLDVEVYSGDLGTTGVFDLGYSAGDEGLETADPNAFIIGVAGTAVALQKMSTEAAINPGLGKVFLDKCFLTATFTTATDAALGVNLKAIVKYAID